MIDRFDEVVGLGNIYGYSAGNFAGSVFDKRGLCPTLLTMGGQQAADNC